MTTGAAISSLRMWRERSVAAVLTGQDVEAGRMAGDARGSASVG